MGTRNVIVVYVDGEYKVAQYGQWDGYPEGQGVGILSFLSNSDIELFKEKVKKCRYLTPEEDKQQWITAGADSENESGFVSMVVFNKHKELFPENSRDTGSDVLSLIYESENGLGLCDSLDFIKDSLFCEWVYVIDLDKNVFEVYKGFVREKLNKNDRFYFMGDEEEEYQPVKRVHSFRLDLLPDEKEFVEIIYSQLEEKADDECEV